MEVLHANPALDADHEVCNDDLQRLRRQYMQMVPIRRLHLPPGSFLKKPDVQRFLFVSMFKAGDLAPSYKFQVLKSIIESIDFAITDPNQDEVIEELYSEFASLLPHSRPSATAGETQPQESTVTFAEPVPLDRRPGITLKSSEMTNTFSVAGGTGHRTWEASLHLGYFLCSERGRDLTRNKNVLELGAGKGLVSYLCASCLGSRQVFATDGDANCVQDLQSHPPSHDTGWAPSMLLWDAGYIDGSPIPDLSSTAQGDLDLILGADITFDKRLMPDLVRTICHLLRSNTKAQAFISATLRNVETFEAFREACQTESLSLMNVDYRCPDTEAFQTGLFHTHDIPIRIVQITTDGQK